MPSASLFTLVVIAASSPLEPGLPLYSYDSFLKCEVVRQAIAAEAIFGNPNVLFACRQYGLPDQGPAE